MRILLSNDDGYYAPPIALLAEMLAPLAEVTVVAPERDRSGSSNSLTLDRPLTVRRANSGFFYVNGTPTDCVHVALTGLLAEPPDLVVSGHQRRRQHGRGHALLRHRGRRDRGLPAGRSVDRDLARPARRGKLRRCGQDRGRADRALPGHAARRAVAAQRQRARPGVRRAARRAGDAARPPAQGRTGRQDDESARGDGVLGRGGRRGAGRGGGNGFPRGRERPGLDNAAAGGPHAGGAARSAAGVAGTGT